MRLADIDRGSGDFVAALASLERAIETHPNILPPRVRLGQLYLQTGRTELALSVTEDWLIAFPQDPALLEVVGRAQLAVRRFSDAVDTLRQLVHRLSLLLSVEN